MVPTEKKRKFFKQRFPGFKKKVTELSVLCGNSAVFICYGPDNELHVWPEPKQNPQAISQIVEKFDAQSDLKKKKHACDLNDFRDHLDGFCLEDLESRLFGINSHLFEIRQQKSVIRNKTRESAVC